VEGEVVFSLHISYEYLLWEWSRPSLLTPSYALEEARRNLKGSEQQAKLESLLVSMNVVEATSEPEGHPTLRSVDLPEKDRHILLAAVAARGTYLVTGDITHFGPYYGREIAGVKILPPAAYLRNLSEEP
jgi:uncharacterized protein